MDGRRINTASPGRARRPPPSGPLSSPHHPYPATYDLAWRVRAAFGASHVSDGQRVPTVDDGTVGVPTVASQWSRTLHSLAARLGSA